jgi:hypothetical protein
VSNDNHGAACTHRAHIVLYDTLRFEVERARRFVENQDAGIGDERAGNRNTLPLSSR